MAQYKFLHAADLHIDSPLRGLSTYEGIPADQIRLATREAFVNLIDLAVDEAVAFVVIAGDLYDGEWDDFGTGLFFCGQMRRLNDAGIHVYIALGNHDAQSVQTKRLPLPANVRVFNHRSPESLIDDATGAVLHGQSYKDRDPGGNLVIGYPTKQSGALNIGVLHTALTGGRPPHANYAPCTTDELLAKGYDYWALGHVHNHEVVATHPYIVFPGNLQGRNIRECGPKGAVIVEIVDNEIGGIESIPLDVVRWARIEVDVSTCVDILGVEGCARSALAEAHRIEADGRPLIARVLFVGSSAMHGTLLQRAELLREEIRGIAAAISETFWIEKVVISTDPIALPPGGEGDDIANSLGRAADDTEFLTSLAVELIPFFSKIPADLVDESRLLSSARDGTFDALLRDAAASLKSRLGQESR